MCNLSIRLITLSPLTMMDLRVVWIPLLDHENKHVPLKRYMRNSSLPLKSHILAVTATIRGWKATEANFHQNQFTTFFGQCNRFRERCKKAIGHLLTP